MDSLTITNLGILSGEVLMSLEDQQRHPAPRQRWARFFGEPKELIDLSLEHLLKEELTGTASEGYDASRFC